jgi:hypothetical protein
MNYSFIQDFFFKNVIEFLITGFHSKMKLLKITAWNLNPPRKLLSTAGGACESIFDTFSFSSGILLFTTPDQNVHK